MGIFFHIDARQVKAKRGKGLKAPDVAVNDRSRITLSF